MFQQNKKNGDFNPIEGRREPSKSSPLAADLISVEAIAGRRSAAHIPKQPGPGGWSLGGVIAACAQFSHGWAPGHWQTTPAALEDEFLWAFT